MKKTKKLKTRRSLTAVNLQTIMKNSGQICFSSYSNTVMVSQLEMSGDLISQLCILTKVIQII